MEAEKLKEVLAQHRLWLEGKGGKRADLRGADLREANLSWADLRRAVLSRADLGWADLSGADLSGADLREANLSWADLTEADLSEADLRGADLREANLTRADLSWADLREANLTRADLSWADLRGADLRGTDLTDTGLIVLHLPVWTAYVQHTHTRIACKYYSNDEWRAFSDKEIAAMDYRALSWWKQHKPLVLAAMEAVK